MTVKIKKIELNGFRGALYPVSLEFPNNGDSKLVLYGEGGSGKTTFTEAIEWFFRDEIKSLEREFCGKESYFNLRLDKDKNAVVRLEFNNNNFDSTKTLPRKGLSSHSNDSTEFQNYLTSSPKENFILSHYDLKSFVDDKRKTDKLEHFAKLTGFEKVIEVRSILMQSFNTLKDSPEIIRISGQLDEAKRFLVDKLKSEMITEETILTYIKGQLKMAKPELTIENLSGIPAIVKNLDELADTSETSKRKHILETLKEQLEKSEQVWSSVLNEITQWTNEYKSYLADAEAIQKESLVKLYSIGRQILSSVEWTDKEKCPLCGNVIDGKSLIEYLSAEIVRIESSLEKRKILEGKYKATDSNITSAISKLKNDLDTMIFPRFFGHSIKLGCHSLQLK